MLLAEVIFVIAYSINNLFHFPELPGKGTFIQHLPEPHIGYMQGSQQIVPLMR